MSNKCMREEKEYRFYTEEDGPEEATSFMSIWDPERCPGESEYLAQDAGECLHDHQPDVYRYPDEWPIILIVETMEGKIIGKFSVSMEYSLDFSASELD